MEQPPYDDSSLEQPATQLAGANPYGVRSYSSQEGQRSPDAKSWLSEHSPFAFNRQAFLVTGAALAAIIAVTIGGVLLATRHSNTGGSSANSAYPTQSVSDQVAQDYDNLLGNGSSKLRVNGQLQVSQSVTLTPTNTPSNPQPGQLYVSKNSNQLYYYDGTQTVDLSNIGQVQQQLTDLHAQVQQQAVRQAQLEAQTGGGGVTKTDLNRVAARIPRLFVASLQGKSGRVTLLGGQGIGISGTTISNTGVTSLQGKTGQVAFQAGDGIKLSGTTVANSGVINLVSSSPNVHITDDGNGTFSVSVDSSASAIGGTGTSGSIAMFTGGNTIGDSLILQNGSTVNVTGTLQENGQAVCTAANNVCTDTNTTYTAGNGLILAGTQFSVNAIACTASQVLTWDGTQFACKADNPGTSYTAGTALTLDGSNKFNLNVGTGLSVDGTNTLTNNGVLTFAAGSGLTNYGTTQNPNVGLMSCSDGQILKYDGVSGNWTCATDDTGTGDGNTTYTAGSGLILTGTQFSVNASACTASQVLTWTGTAFQCKTDDTGSVGVASVNSLNGDLVLGGTAGQVSVTDNGTDALTLSLDPNVSLLGQSIGTSELEDGAVSTSKLLDAAVTTVKIAAATITGSNIASNTVTNTNLVNSSVTINTDSNLTGGGAVSLGGGLTLGVGANVALLNQAVNFTGASLQFNGKDVCTAAGNCGYQGSGTGAGVASLNSLSGDVLLDGTSGQIGVTSDGLGTLTFSLDSNVSLLGQTIELGTETTGTYQAGTTVGSGLTLTGTPGAGWTPSIALDSTVCRTAGNCAGTGNGGGATNAGSQNYLTKTDASGNLVDSQFYDDGTGVGIGTSTPGYKFDVQAGAGVVAQFSGRVIGADAVNNNEFVTKNQLDSAVGAGSSGVASLNSLAGGLTLQGTAGKVTVSDNGTNTITLNLDPSVSLLGQTIESSEITDGTIQNADLSTGNFTNITGVGTLTVGAINWSGNIATTGDITGNTINGTVINQNGNQVCDTSDNCGYGGAGTGAGVASLNSLSGDLTIQGNGQIAVNASSPNISLSIQADSIGDGQLAFDTGQNLTVTDTPTFVGLKITGNTTANRPASPTEGQLYYDTTTHTLLTYGNGKWQADRSTATKIVAASNSSQAEKDAADYVATGTGDQATINAALTAAAGGKVYLMEGTYTINGSISVPNNTTLAGAGAGTLITIPNGSNPSIDAITNTDTTTGAGITIQDLRLDGNEANQTSGSAGGIGLYAVGTAGARGATITNVQSDNWSSTGFYVESSSNITITANTAKGDGGGFGFYVESSSNINATANSVQGYSNGFYIDASSHSTFTGNNVVASASAFEVDGSTNDTFTGNDIENSSTGWSLFGGGNHVITGNTFTSNSLGIYMDDAAPGSNTGGNVITGNTFQGNQSGLEIDAGDSNTITGNTFTDSGGTTGNEAIFLASNSNQVTNNTITDSSHTTSNYAIEINTGTTANYLAGNTLGGAAINDLGTGTVYGGQLDASNNYIIQPSSGTINLNAATNVTGNLAASGTIKQGGNQVCDVSGNCGYTGAGTGAGVASVNGLNGDLTVQGTAGQISFSSAGTTITASLDPQVSLLGQTIDNSELANSSITINTGSNLTGGNTVALGGSINIGLGANVAILNQPANFTGTYLQFNGSDVCTAATKCGYGGSGTGAGVASLNALSGDLTIQGNSQIAVDATSSPYIKLSLQANSIGDGQLVHATGQDLTTADAPSFAGLTVTGASNSAFTGTVSGADATADNQFVTRGQLSTAIGGVGSGISNAGTTNYLTKSNSSGNLVNSQLYDDGTNVGIGTTAPGAQLDVAGSARIKTDSATAFQIQDSSSDSLFMVDSIQKRLGIGTTSPQATLDIQALSSADVVHITAVSGGTAALAPSAPSTIYTGLGNQGPTTGSQSAKLDSSHIASIFTDDSSTSISNMCGYTGSTRSYCVAVSIGTVGANGITYGSPYILENSTSNPNNPVPATSYSVIALSSTKIAVTYFSGPSNTSVVQVCTVSGNTLSACGGTQFTVYNNNNDPISLTALNATTFVESNYAGARVDTVSGNVITPGSKANLTLGSSGSVTSLATLSSTSFVAAGSSGTAAIGTVSGTTITWGSTYAWSSGAVSGLTTDAIAVLSSTSFAVGGAGAVTVGTVSGTTITFGSPYGIGTTNALGLAPLTSTTFAAAYATNAGMASVVGTVSGTTVTYSSQVNLDTSCAANCAGVSVVAPSSSMIYVAYTNTSTKVMYGVVGASASGAVVGASALVVTGDTSFTGNLSINGVAGISVTCSSGQALNGAKVVAGLIVGGSCSTNGFDLAEQYSSSQSLKPGEIVAVAMGDYRNVERSTLPQQDDLIGVVSTKPDHVLSDGAPGYPVALVGRVPVKVNLEGGVIHKGDKITSSSTPGVGMRANGPGMIIGTALEDYDGTTQSGSIEVFVHTSYYSPVGGGSIQGTDLTIAGSASIEGDLAVSGAITTTTLTVNGHIITAGDAPVVAVEQGAGIADAANGITAPVVTITGNDTSGTITITTGANTSAAALVMLHFNKTFGSVPRVVLTPANHVSAAIGAYYDASTTTTDGFSILTDQTPQPNTTYSFTYFVVQ